MDIDREKRYFNYGELRHMICCCGNWGNIGKGMRIKFGNNSRYR